MAASTLNLQHIDASVARIMWHVRWTTKGLMPVKPALQFSTSFELAPGRAVNLTNAAN